MSDPNTIRLDNVFYITPEQMLDVGQRLPVTSNFYVPLHIFDIDFTLRTPTIEACGNGAIRMALDRSFGFMRAEYGTILTSQKTNGLILAPSPEGPNKWHATLQTPDPITDQDANLFSRGIGLYASYVRDKINLRGQSY